MVTIRDRLRGSLLEALFRPEDAFEKPSDCLLLYTGTYLFLSFDLVNSTEYKSKNIAWPNVFKFFYEESKRAVDSAFKRGDAESYFSSVFEWKKAGDEVLFFIPVAHYRGLVLAPRLAYRALHSAIAKLKELPKTDASLSTKDNAMLSIKATLWSAFVEDNDDPATAGTDRAHSQNIVVVDSEYHKHHLDFLGPDIDTGFRIAKYSLAGKLVVGAQLACAIAESANDDGESNFLKIVSYEQLKGVWDNRHYPIVWYHHEWDDPSKMYRYDERFQSDIVARMLDERNRGTVSSLKRVFEDLGRYEEVARLVDGVKASSINFVHKFFKLNEVPQERLSEIHLVAICFDANRQVLVAKRSQERSLHPAKWEFGGAQLHLRQSIEDCLAIGYEKLFGLALDFRNRPAIPISTYHFNESDYDRLVPGIVFIASVHPSQTGPSVDDTKHSEAHWMRYSELVALDAQSCVPGFHDHLEAAFERYDALRQSESVLK